MFSCGALLRSRDRGRPLGLATAKGLRAGRSIPSQPPLLLARGERRSARDTQRSRAQRAWKQARAFWWGARSALGAPGFVTLQTDYPATEYVAPAPSSSRAAHAPVTNYLAPTPDLWSGASHQQVISRRLQHQWLLAHLSIWNTSTRCTRNRSLQGRQHRTSSRQCSTLHLRWQGHVLMGIVTTLQTSYNKRCLVLRLRVLLLLCCMEPQWTKAWRPWQVWIWIVMAFHTSYSNTRVVLPRWPWLRATSPWKSSKTWRINSLLFAMSFLTETRTLSSSTWSTNWWNGCTTPIRRNSPTMLGQPSLPLVRWGCRRRGRHRRGLRHRCTRLRHSYPVHSGVQVREPAQDRTTPKRSLSWWCHSLGHVKHIRGAVRDWAGAGTLNIPGELSETDRVLMVLEWKWCAVYVFKGPDDLNGNGYFYARLCWTGLGLQASIDEEYVVLCALLHIFAGLKRTSEQKLSHGLMSG